MTNLVAMDTFKNRVKDAEEQKRKTTEPKQNQNISESYFIHVGHQEDDILRVDFGGAFVRDLIEKLEINREAVLTAVTNHNKEYIPNLYKQAGLDDESIELVKELFLNNIKMLEEATDIMKTQEDFDNMMSQGSIYLMLMPELISAIMYCSYTEFDLRRMVKQRWLMINKRPDEFLTIIETFYKK